MTIWSSEIKDLRTHIILCFLFCFSFSCVSHRNAQVVINETQEERYLIITADDFGASRNINEGIKIAAENKSITSISVLSNFSESLTELLELTIKYPNIDIGVHLNIVTGNPILKVEEVSSLVDTNGSFYTINEILPILENISINELRNELRAQILVLDNYGIKIKFLSDQCGILSYYTPFFEVIIELATEFDLPVRTTISAGAKYPKLYCNRRLKKHYRQIAINSAYHSPFRIWKLLKYRKLSEMERKAEKLDEYGILHPDLMIMNFWGEPTASNLLVILENLPEGTSELILHLGTYTRQVDYPSGLNLSYFENREHELITISSKYLNEYYKKLNITPINYSDLVNKED